MGAYAITEGMFSRGSLNTIRGVDKLIYILLLAGLDAVNSMTIWPSGPRRCI